MDTEYLEYQVNKSIKHGSLESMAWVLRTIQDVRSWIKSPNKDFCPFDEQCICFCYHQWPGLENTREEVGGIFVNLCPCDATERGGKLFKEAPTKYRLQDSTLLEYAYHVLVTLNHLLVSFELARGIILPPLDELEY